MASSDRGPTADESAAEFADIASARCRY